MVERWRDPEVKVRFLLFYFFYSLFLINKEDTYEYWNRRFGNEKNRDIRSEE